MMMLNANKQKMFYALYGAEVPIYDYYTDEEGNQIPIDTGEVQIVFNKPVQFSNGISGKLSEALIETFGVNDSSMYAQMNYLANEYPFEVGTLIWKKSEIKYKDEEKTIPDPISADYTVAGILDEFPNVWSCLLKRVVK